MNGMRILLGGLLAGIVINVSEAILNGVVIMDEMEAMMASTGLTEASWAIAGFVVTGFVVGLVVAWTYAAIRPRFGPGWKTGALAGLVPWILSYLVGSVWFGAMGLSMDAGSTTLALVWGLVELVLAGVVAGWVYRESATAVASGAPAARPPATV